MYGRLGFMVNNHLTPRAEPGRRMVSINPSLTCMMRYILQPGPCCYVLVKTQGNLHCKQGMLLPSALARGFE